MAERYWENNTPRRHAYIGEDGRVIGAIQQRLADKWFEGYAYDPATNTREYTRRDVGEFTRLDAARAAVEAACVAIDTEQRLLAEARAAQADGART